MAVFKDTAGVRTLVIEASEFPGHSETYIGFEDEDAFGQFKPEQVPEMMLALAEAAGLDGSSDETLTDALVALRKYVQSAKEQAKQAEAMRVMDRRAKALYERTAKSDRLPQKWEELTYTQQTRWRLTVMNVMDVLAEEG